MSQVEDWIREGEHQTQDFKFAIDDQKKIARTLSAFSNTDGGRLLIGVKDNGKIVGCNPEEEFHMIQGAAELYCQPPIAFEGTVHQEGFRQVLEIQVSALEKSRVKAKDEEDKWKFYFRQEDQTLLVGKILYRVWKQKENPRAKPETFGEEEQQLLSLIDQEGITLSKLYRKSSLSKSRVDHWLVLLICWDLVEMVYTASSTLYRLRE